MSRNYSRRLLLVAALSIVGAVFSFGAESSSLKVIKFEAEWCGPCKAMRPAYNKVSKSEPGVEFQTVDIDQQPKVANSYQVEVVPTIVAVKDGRVVGRLIGLQSEAQLRKFIKKNR